MISQEIRIRCIKTFNLQQLNPRSGKWEETPIEIRKRRVGIAIKHVLPDGKRFYEVEMARIMFSMKQKSFDEFMEELPAKEKVL